MKNDRQMTPASWTVHLLRCGRAGRCGFLVVLPLCLLVAVAGAADARVAKDGLELTQLLNRFLAGASRDDPAVHQEFWAEDLVYTSSAGRRMGKADILRDLAATPARRPDEPGTIYTAEDIRIQQYGNTAVVAFRLVGTTTTTKVVDPGAAEVHRYLNTGTFVRRDGKWQVVAWQATRLPDPSGEPETP